MLDEKINKEEVLKKMRNRGIEVGTLYPLPCYLHPIYRKLGYRQGLCPVTEHIMAHQIFLPMFAEMKDVEIDYVLDCLKKIVKDYI